MTGAIAGSTAIVHREVSDKLQVITLTVNNGCNLHCPHCYLQYDAPNEVANEMTLEAVLSSSARHVAIVGKEPLMNAPSVAATEKLIDRCISMGKSVSLVTNGFGLDRLSDTSIRQVDWIDVSLDGGVTTYSQYRHADFAKVIQNVHECLERGLRLVNALHTVSSLNIENIDDMMSISDLIHWNKIVFSPYTQTRNHGTNTTSAVALKTFLCALRKSESFLKHDSAVLLTGRHSFEDQGMDVQQVSTLIEAMGLSHKAIQIKHDPLLLGYIRVTYDGYVMTPYQSLHPADYRAFAVLLEEYGSLDTAFKYLRAA